MIVAGLESKPPIETLIHVLLIASKTGAAIAETGQEHLAIEILTRAADFEQLLSAAPDPDGLHEKPRAAAVITYYASRMETVRSYCFNIEREGIPFMRL
ncbi:hypothetical protein SISSUDRAFT_1051394 [Sistotremastrum suecicum HHB10207 ss-3]|uniref:Uncharacterized protein n=1 Tax=Sistotremastrum suecicum HHB10207 ss-3 TaxID=1314776 RepID=A0A166AL82_9AGAM|nr:hypothetical protein SISSUDRAFT_1051394 [Sistotremastrum suecicum HHB10207 ss-3]